MEIYVVQQGDSIYSIAEKYGVSVEKIIQDNELQYPYDLVIGQAMVIAFPKQSHIVQDGDTLQSIADFYHVTLMQLLRNNPNLSERKFLYPGESLIISYNTSRSITTNGFAYPFIRRETLIKTLPNLTYLSVFNYTVTEKGEMVTYYDDTTIIKTIKDYLVIPLLVLTTLTPQGVPDIKTAYDILLNEEYQDNAINQFISIMHSKGYLGINLFLDFLNENNQSLYHNLIQRISNRLQQENFKFFITINYDVRKEDGTIVIEQVNYSNFSSYVDGMIFLKFVWGTNDNPPAPVSNISYLRALTEYVISQVSPDKVIVGKPILGYDWRLPFIPNESYATSLTINSVLILANDAGAIIEFDEESQTPYFYYYEFGFTYPAQHVVWFIDARSIEVLNRLIIDYLLNGSGVWNIMIYNQQLWTITNSTFDIVKLI
ncbi:LysM peptidoglycan-binding domain-containing protein [Anaerocolumna sedimenticola]|uniref:LysM peptidoglycan-binding domain-containing protein n=1 Tax=Anaerocolumna sedimenticola TaxID=2696063 RepID=A0A6P1TRB1_9FIRM|nr:LysM peptidoglycan-binding domain-containing protein [Anaerocolumna sedimenticola]QHQ63013.1 LysM peptidoglycan-binding domain-containing protein [Anaerocolumna sedimenticola]